MLLGKRPRPSIRRTTSMTGITFDLSVADAADPSDSSNPRQVLEPPPPVYPQISPNSGYDPRLLSMLSPRNSRRSFSDPIETPNFLKSCGLCKHRLIPGRDIYMYKGDTAFCSLECREQRIKQDERKEKMKVAAAAASRKEDGNLHASKASSSTKSQTVVAA